jgi:hypothetical protein
MIRVTLLRKLVVAGLLLNAAAFAQEVRSGLPVGATTESIPVFDVTGPYKGERICYVCDFETDPNVLGFFRETSEETARLIVQLNQLYVKNKARNFKAVAMIVAGDSAKKWLEDLSRKEKLEIPLTYFARGPKDVAARLYKLNPEVQNTFLVTVDRTVAANVSGIAANEFGQVASATEQMLAANNRKQ